MTFYGKRNYLKVEHKNDLGKFSRERRREIEYRDTIYGDWNWFQKEDLKGEYPKYFKYCDEIDSYQNNWELCEKEEIENYLINEIKKLEKTLKEL